MFVATFEVPDIEHVCEIVGLLIHLDVNTFIHTFMIIFYHRTLPTLNKVLIHCSSCLVILGDMLCGRGIDGIILICFNLEEANIGLHEIHEGICGSNSSGPTLTKKFLRTGYYWFII